MRRLSALDVTLRGEARLDPCKLPISSEGYPFVTIMPSKMDVAPWDKHWIKREFEGFGMYSMVFVQIQ